MGIFNRMSNMLKAKVNSTLDEMENPIELLDQKIKDMEEQLSEAKLNAANVLGNTKLVEKKLHAAEAEAVDYENKIKIALSKNNEDLAKRALAKKLEAEKKVEKLKGTYETSKAQSDALKQNLAALQEELEKTREYRDEAAARYATAQANKEVNAIISDVKTKNNSISLDNIERKISKEESLAKGLDDLSDLNDDLDAEFEKLDQVDLDAELEKYK